MLKAWADPLNHEPSGIPEECTPSRGVYDYDPEFHSLLSDAVTSVCWAWPEVRGGWVHVRVFANIWGNRGCGGARLRKSTSFRLTGENPVLLGDGVRYAYRQYKPPLFGWLAAGSFA
jgi:hypothetical protein